MRFILGLFSFIVLFQISAVAQADVKLRNFTFKDDGRLFFPDGTSQSTASLQGLKGDKGDAGPTGSQGAKGDLGPACTPALTPCQPGQVYVQTATGLQCGTLTPFINAIGTCVGASCTLICMTGTGNCDNQTATGCENDLYFDGMNCGACGHACSESETCQWGSCEQSF